METGRWDRRTRRPFVSECRVSTCPDRPGPRSSASRNERSIISASLRAHTTESRASAETASATRNASKVEAHSQGMGGDFHSRFVPSSFE